MGQRKSLRREILIAFGVLFAGGILVASLWVAILLPYLTSPAQALLYIGIMLIADLTILFLFGGVALERVVLKPLDRLVGDVQAIASGSFSHLVRPTPGKELQAVADSVNEMAERLIHDQEALAANVRSLDETNVALVEARAQVVRAARLASTGTLAAGIAHELGNPLGALMAYVDVARSREESRGGDTELLGSVREEAGRIDRIIRSLLDFARSKDTATAPHDPWPIVQRVKDLLEAQGKLERAETVWEGGDLDFPEVLIDPQRLEQILLNLLLNAFDAIKGQDEGWIRVRLRVEEGPAATMPRRRAGDPPGVNYAHRRRILSADEGLRVAPMANAFRVVVATVEDNGTGLAPENLEEVFDPFFTTKEPGEGTGLGLALSAQLVEGMGGEIEAANRPDGGAVFSVSLPEFRLMEETDESRADSEGAGAGPSDDTEVGGDL
jgi:two-component system NtrC family sensor kinase